MEKRTVRGKYIKPTKWEYLIEIFKAMFSFAFFKHVFHLYAYYNINYVVGKRKAKIGKSSNIHPTVIFRQGERIFIGENCLINHNNVLQAGKISGKIIIGDYVQTGANVMFFAFNHGTELIETPMISQDYIDADIIIEDDVWIGAGSVILSGVKIAKGAVVAANTVVNKDVPPFTIVGGVPARILKKRN